MIWEDEVVDDIIEELLYWQKRALQAEKEREYFKAQFLAKDEEMKKVLRMSGDR